MTPVWAGNVPDRPSTLGWSADGYRLAVVAGAGPVLLFNTSNGNVAAQLVGHAGGTLAIEWNPTAPVLATAGKDGRVRVWDVSGRETHCLEANGERVEHLAWHPDGDVLAAASGRTIRLWDAAGRIVTDVTDHPNPVAALAWRPDSRTLTALVSDGAILWTIRPTPIAPSFRVLPWEGPTVRMAWSPDAAVLAHSNRDATVHCWYVETAEELQMRGHATQGGELSWDATSCYLATGDGPTVCVWDCGGEDQAEGKQQVLRGHAEDATVTAVAFQHGGGLLASAGSDGRVNVWQPTRPKQPLVGTAEADAAVCGLAWSSDDRRLAYTTESGAVVLLAVS